MRPSPTCISPSNRTIVLALSSALCLQAPAAEDLHSIQTRISELETSLAGETLEYESARAEVLEIERQLHAARQQNRALRAQLDTKLDRITELRAQRETAEREHDSSAENLKQVLRVRFQQQHANKLKVLLGATKVTQLQRNLKYYEYFAQANAASLQLHGKRLSELYGIESALKLEATKLRQIRSTAESHLTELTSAFDIRNRVAKSLEDLLHNNRRSLEQLRDDENELTDLVDDMIEERPATRAGAAPFGGLKGMLQWPTSGRIAKAPGSAMRDGGAKWGGVIIESSPGSEVVAIAAGRVAFADWFRNLGLLLIVDHGDGYMSLYGHNQEIFKAIGDPVAAGERVALVGDTGGRSTVGLYFEIRENGAPQDPRRWCKK